MKKRNTSIKTYKLNNVIYVKYCKIKGKRTGGTRIQKLKYKETKNYGTNNSASNQRKNF